MTQKKTKKRATLPTSKKAVLILLGAIIVFIGLATLVPYMITSQLLAARSLPWRGGSGTDMQSLQTNFTKLDLPKPDSTYIDNSGCKTDGFNTSTAYCMRSITYLYKDSAAFWPTLHTKLITEGWVFSTTPGGTTYDGTDMSRGVIAYMPTACLSIDLQLDHTGSGGWGDTYAGVITMSARGSNLCYGTSTNPQDN